MRHDPFFRKRVPDPDAVVKSAPVQVEKEWSDAAREAAAEARRHGYEGTRQSRLSRDRQDGAEHKLTVRPSGSWTHETVGHTHAVMARGGFNSSHPDKESALRAAKLERGGGRGGANVERIPKDLRWQSSMTNGRDVASLKRHLVSTHGKPETRRKAETFSPTEKAAPETARPPGPRVIEVDGDQDSLARTAESGDPTDSWRPGFTTDAPEEGGGLVSPVGKGDVFSPVQSETFSPIAKAWSDEAREAAAEARRHGYGRTTSRPSGGAIMEHPKGHRIQIRPAGEWSHRQDMGRTVMGPKGTQIPEMRSEGGKGAASLRGHLRTVHGSSAVSTSRRR